MTLINTKLLFLTSKVPSDLCLNHAMCKCFKAGVLNLILRWKVNFVIVSKRKLWVVLVAFFCPVTVWIIALVVHPASPLNHWTTGCATGVTRARKELLTFENESCSFNYFTAITLKLNVTVFAFNGIQGETFCALMKAQRATVDAFLVYLKWHKVLKTYFTYFTPGVFYFLHHPRPKA